jgi:hypothetical protein
MTALTDSEILAVLPLDARKKIDSAFEALSQSLPTDRERIILYRVAHTLKLNPTDTHFSVMAALHYYLQLYQTIPDKIGRAGVESLKGHELALKAQADLVMAESQKTLIETARKSVSEIASKEIARAAEQLAGDVTAKERNKFFWLATSAMAVCALVFGGTGYALRMGSDALNMSMAVAKAGEANERANTDIATAEKKASDEIDAARKSSGWAGTEEGRLAKNFFDQGGGVAAAKCDSPVWEIVDSKNGKFCVPNRRDLIGGDSNKYGWKIP